MSESSKISLDTWLKPHPFIIAMRHLQSFDVDELTKEETKELVKDIIKNGGVSAFLQATSEN